MGIFTGRKESLWETLKTGNDLSAYWQKFRALLIIIPLISYISDFQPFSSHGTRKLIIKILWHSKKYIIFANATPPNRYNFDSVTPEGHCCVGSCFYLMISGKKAQCPWLSSQVLHVLKILAAHQLKIAVLGAFQSYGENRNQNNINSASKCWCRNQGKSYFH